MPENIYKFSTKPDRHINTKLSKTAKHIIIPSLLISFELIEYEMTNSGWRGFVKLFVCDEDEGLYNTHHVCMLALTNIHSPP